jgi:hypothetical protein
VGLPHQFVRGLLHLFRGLQCGFSGRRQRVAIGRAQEERRAQCVLERGDAAADGRLVDADDFRGAP